MPAPPGSRAELPAPLGSGHCTSHLRYTSRMRTSLLAGLIAGGVVAWLSFSHALSNADFIYMCCGAALADKGRLLVSPYFPPLYPLLVWAVVQAGVTALNAGVLLSALGTALSAGGVSYMARLWRLPAAPALGLGLLAASLPDVFEIAFNPHLDALYTGLAVVFIAAALRALIAKPNTGVGIAAVLSTAMLLTLRWHAVILVLPVMLVLLCMKRARRVGLAMLIAAAVALGWSYWTLYVTCGSVHLAGWVQVLVGTEYRQLGPQQAVYNIYHDYPQFLSQGPARVDWLLAWENIKANYVEFLTRKSILIGAGVWLLALIFWQRCAAHSFWLVLLIAGYTLPISAAYFTPRASALPELCGLLLLAAGLSVLLPWGEHQRAGSQRGSGGAGRGGGRRRGAAQAWMDPALAGVLLFILCLAGLGYDGWREWQVPGQWRAERKAVWQADAQALELTGGRREQVYGAMDRCGWTVGKWSLPAATYSRLWLDDPTIAPLFATLIPRYGTREVLDGQAPVRVIVLWNEGSNELERQLGAELATSWTWREQHTSPTGPRLWLRGP